MLTAAIVVTTIVVVGFLLAYMLAQKSVTTVQKLIQQHRYEEAAQQPAADSADYLHLGEALKLLGRFDDAIAAYKRSDDPAAREGIALSLAHQGRDLDQAKQLMEQTIAMFPQIQEFQALALAYILLKKGERDAAMRTFNDNVELLETRFRDDYTDADPLLAETLFMFAELARAAGETERAATLRKQAARWAPGSVWSG